MSGMVLVTGGSSFLGASVARRLEADGRTVRVLDVAASLDEVRETVLGDVCDPETVASAMRDATAVVHAAFVPPERPTELIDRVNVLGTEVVLGEAARLGVPVVLVSSTIVDRPLRPHPVRRGAPQTRLVHYARSRQQAEALARTAAAGGLPVAVLRPKTFLGPGALGAFAMMFQQLRLGHDVVVLGRGRNCYQLLDVDDFAAAVSVVVGARASGVFGVGATGFGTVASDLEALVAHAGTGSSLRLLPARAAVGALRAVDVASLPPLSEWHQCSARGLDSVVDTGPLQALGWSARWSSSEALCRAYDWYAAQPLATTGTHRVPPLHRGLAAAARLAGRRLR